ncbi:MAG TPA: hypothetical protein DD791_07990 [Syntrophomonas sp.]|jgi:hypothetical protein|nr:hypothetical protein [Syntrophomonas sp.]
MAKMLEIKASRCTLYLTEQELQSLLSRDPNLWREALRRGKAFSRATQTRERVQKKVEKERECKGGSEQ